MFFTREITRNTPRHTLTHSLNAALSKKCYLQRNQSQVIPAARHPTPGRGHGVERDQCPAACKEGGERGTGHEAWHCAGQHAGCRFPLALARLSDWPPGTLAHAGRGGPDVTCRHAAPPTRPAAWAACCGGLCNGERGEHSARRVLVAGRVCDDKEIVLVELRLCCDWKRERNKHARRPSCVPPVGAAAGTAWRKGRRTPATTVFLKTEEHFG